MAKLYQSLFDINNIQLAINTYFKQDTALIAGPDGITKQHFLNSNNQIIKQNILIKEIKLRLRRCATLNYKIINNNIVYNLYDRITQQCIYQKIYSVLKPNISKHNYGFKKFNSIKIPLSKICSVITNSHGVYTINFDFTQYFTAIKLDNMLALIYEAGIRDKKFLSTIKYLLWKTVKLENNSYTISKLEQLLQDCCLCILDHWIESNIEFDSKTRNMHRDLKNHSNNYVEWLLKRKKKPHAKYYRYGNNFVILTQTRSEQLYIYDQLCKFVNEKFKISIIGKLNYNQLDYLNFHIKKMKDINNIWKINITPSNIKDLHIQIKQLKFRSAIECIKSLQKLICLMNYYDITNNLVWLLELIDLRIRRHTHRTGSCLKKIWNKNLNEYEYVFKYCTQEFKFSIWKLRRIFKTSYKEYIIHPLWLMLREHLNDISLQYISPYQLHKWELWNIQKGLDYCTNKLLNPINCHIHHKDGNRLNNQIDNLILINESTHRLIHNYKLTNNQKIITLRKKLNVKTRYKNC